MRRSLIAILAGFAALLLPAFAAGQGWSDPVLVASGSDKVPRAVQGGDQLTVLMWTGEPTPTLRYSGSSVYAADRRAGDGAWSAPVTLTAGGEKAAKPVLAVSGDDRAVVLWTPTGADGAPTSGVRLVERTGAGAWSAPRDVPGIDGAVNGAHFVASGALLVAWSRAERTEWFITRLEPGRWDTPTHMKLPAVTWGPGAVSKLKARFVAAPNGQVALVGVDEVLRLVAMRGTETGSWSEPILLALGGDAGFNDLDAGISPDGQITAIGLDRNYKPIGAHLPPGADTWTAHRFERQAFFSSPRLLLDGSGRPTAFWTTPKWLVPGAGTIGGSPGFLETSTLRADGTWESVFTFRDGERSVPADPISAALTSQGRPMLAWAPHEPFQPANLNVSTRQPDGSWATEQVVPGYDTIADYMTLGADRRGNRTVMWNNNLTGLYVAGTDPALPRAKTSAPPTAGANLRILGHRSRATARWAKLRPKALPVTCRLSIAGTCTFRATINRTTARRLGLRLPKRGPYVAGAKRIAVGANVAKRTHVALKPAARRAITRSLARIATRPLARVTVAVRNTAKAESATAIRTTAFILKAAPRPARAAKRQRATTGAPGGKARQMCAKCGDARYDPKRMTSFRSGYSADIRPRSLCVYSGACVTNMRWSRWNKRVAVGGGRLTESNAGSGQRTRAMTTVTLDQARSKAFRRARWTRPGGNLGVSRATVYSGFYNWVIQR